MRSPFQIVERRCGDALHGGEVLFDRSRPNPFAAFIQRLTVRFDQSEEFGVSNFVHLINEHVILGVFGIRWDVVDPTAFNEIVFLPGCVQVWLAEADGIEDFIRIRGRRGLLGICGA